MSFKIGHFEINKKSKVFIVAELSANHMQNYDLAAKTIIAAKNAGADAIKLQTYTADSMTIDCDKSYFQIDNGTPWDGTTLYQLYKKAYTPWEWQPKLKKIADDNRLIFFSTPFDKGSVDFLEKIDVPVYKIASFEITDIPLIEYAASKGKPMIISTGIAEICDMQEAVDACRKKGNDNIALLKCTSAYPAPFEEMYLNSIPYLSERFGVITGVSDHTRGIAIPIASVAVGGRIIEKHLTLDKKLDTLDAKFSLDPHEFKTMVNGVREVEKALGEKCYKVTKSAIEQKKYARSLFIVKDMKKNDVITDKNVRAIRPGYGISPKYLKSVIGKKVNRDIELGSPLTWDMIDG